MNGNDTVLAGSGDDILVGGAGRDKFTAGSGDDWLMDQFPGVWNLVRQRIPNWALAEFDKEMEVVLPFIEAQLALDGGVNEFVGGAGDDVLIGSRGRDLLEGNAGSDAILGEGFQLEASASYDFIIDYFQSISAFQFDAKLGIVPLPGGNDEILGGDGFDFLLGGNGNDYIDAGRGGAVILGDSFSVSVGVSITESKRDFRWLPEVRRAGLGNDEIYAGSSEGTEDRPLINVVIGGAGDDEIYGGDAFVDLLFGNTGSDTIWGSQIGEVKSGIDVISGDEGSDQLTGSDFANLIVGDSFELKGFVNNGFDSLQDESLSFGVGFELLPIEDLANDTLTGGAGFDVLIGGYGNDTIRGGDGFNVAFGDTFKWGVTVGLKFGDEFEDRTTIGLNPFNWFELLRTKFALEGAGSDTYHGGSGVDIVLGGDGKDIIFGNEGWDFLIGGDEDDQVDGGPGAVFEIDRSRQVIFGGHGNDILRGGDGPDWMESEEGNDEFFGGAGDDIIYGGAGADRLMGEAGNDQLFGEAGDDSLFGGPGDDVLNGGTGNDSYDGGGGSDLIQLTPLWQNPVNSLDVNNDNRVTPIDALLIINRLNDSTKSNMASEYPGPFFIDVNGDGRITPLDALLLINALNQAANSSAEGERQESLKTMEPAGVFYFDDEFVSFNEFEGELDIKKRNAKYNLPVMR